MQAGFLALEAGMTRNKNNIDVSNINNNVRACVCACARAYNTYSISNIYVWNN